MPSAHERFIITLSAYGVRSVFTDRIYVYVPREVRLIANAVAIEMQLPVGCGLSGRTRYYGVSIPSRPSRARSVAPS